MVRCECCAEEFEMTNEQYEYNMEMQENLYCDDCWNTKHHNLPKPVIL